MLLYKHIAVICNRFMRYVALLFVIFQIASEVKLLCYEKTPVTRPLYTPLGVQWNSVFVAYLPSVFSGVLFSLPSVKYLFALFFSFFNYNNMENMLKER